MTRKEITSYDYLHPQGKIYVEDCDLFSERNFKIQSKITVACSKEENQNL